MSRIKIETDKTRVKKLADYLLPIINGLIVNNKNNVNVNMLKKDVYNYSLDKIPTDSVVETWITGVKIYKDVYDFKTRNEYSVEQITNMQNIGFYENFENIIETNNDEGNLPNIEGIESIECLNCGTLNNAQNNTCEMDIQIQITYRK